MSAADEIQSAIDKLTKLKEDSSPGPWRSDGPDYHFYGDDDGDYVNTSLVSGADRDGVLAAIPPVTAVPFVDDRDKRTVVEFKGNSYSEWAPRATADVALTATLHGTIDAQLVILEWAHDLYSLPNREHPSPLETRALALARAINGGN